MAVSQGKRSATAAPNGDQPPVQRARTEPAADDASRATRSEAIETTPKKVVRAPQKKASNRPAQTLPPQVTPFPTPNIPKTTKKPQMPAASHTWDFFGDVLSSRFLATAGEREEFKVAALYFHARLALVVRGLALDQLKNIYTFTLPLYLQVAPRFERDQGEKVFLDAYDAIQALIVNRAREYAEMWLETPGGADFRDRQLWAKKKKRGGAPPVPNGSNISMYNGLQCIQFDRIQVIDVFLPCMSAVETVPCDGRGTLWLKFDRKDTWFDALKQVSATLIVGLAKQIVDGEAAARVAAKDPSAPAHLEEQARQELSQKKINDALRSNQNFPFDSKEWDTRGSIWMKTELNLRAPFTYDANIETFWGSPPVKPQVTLKGRMIVSDPMALHVRDAQEQAEMEEVVDPAIKAEEEEASAEYQSEFDQNISAIESNFGVSYDREKPYDGLTDPTLEAADAFDLGRAYLEKGPIGRIIMVRQNVAMECQRLAAMTVAALTKSKALELQLQKLDEEEEMRQTTREVLAKTLAKNKAMSAKVRGKQAAALTSMSSGNRSSGSGFGFGVGYGGAQESSSLSANPVASVLDRFGGGYSRTGAPSE